MAKWNISALPMRLLTLFISYSALGAIVGITFAIRNIRNLFLTHIYALVAYSAVVFIFSCWYEDKLRHYIRLSIPAYIMFYLLLLRLGYEHLDMPASISLVVMSAVVSFLSLYTLFSVLKSSTILPFYDERFWVSIGSLFVFTSNVVIYSGIKSGITIDIWITHNNLNVIGYLCYFGGYLWTRTQTT